MPVIHRELGRGLKWRKMSALVNNSKQDICGFEDDNLMFFQVGFTGRRPGVFTRIYQLPVTEVNFIHRRRDMPRGVHGTINSWCVECIFRLNARKICLRSCKVFWWDLLIMLSFSFLQATALVLSIHFFPPKKSLDLFHSKDKIFKTLF